MTSTLVGSGHAPRQTVGSVNTTEFLVTVASATTFFVEPDAAPLAVTGCRSCSAAGLAAPVGGWAVKHVSAARLMIAVGCLIVTLSCLAAGAESSS